MGIEMRPEYFPELHRQDPMRRAEARVFDAIQKMQLDGRGIFECRFRTGGTQLDYAFWGDGLGRFAKQVKGGQNEVDDDGRWYLHTADGDRKGIPSPLDQTTRGRIDMHNGLEKATGYYCFVAGVLIFPDMERNEDIEQFALRKDLVHTIWGVDHLQEDLERVARDVGFKRPPTPAHSDREWRLVNQMLRRNDDELQDGRRQPVETEGEPVKDGNSKIEVETGSVVINIQHLDKLVVQHYHLDRDSGGELLLPEP